MPGWNLHLEAGNRLADKLKLSGQHRREFLLGCILPDINNGYVNRVSTEKPHSETHYAFDQKSSLNFYADHQSEIDNLTPIYLGYLLHLYTDGYFNYNFYHYIKRSPLGEGLDREAKRKIKHHDFWLYDTNFQHQLDLGDETSLAALVKTANHVPAVTITADDLKDVNRILTSDDFRKLTIGEKYIFYNRAKLDALLDEMLESFSRNYLGEKDA